MPSSVMLLILLAGCGGGGGSGDTPSPKEQAEQGTPVLGQTGDEEPAGPALGFPVFATKNTTRVGGADPVADAAGVAQAVYPSRSEDTRPQAVVLVDQDDWRAGHRGRATGRRRRCARRLLFTEGERPAQGDGRRARQAPAVRRQSRRGARR